MIVAVAIVRTMQVARDQVLRVVAMRHCLMSTDRAVDMLRIVAVAGVAVGAGVRVLRAHLERVLVYMSVMRVGMWPSWRKSTWSSC